MTGSVPEQHDANSSVHAAILGSKAQPPPLDPDPLPATKKTLLSLNASFSSFQSVDPECKHASTGVMQLQEMVRSYGDVIRTGC